MQLMDVMQEARDKLGARGVFGEPYEKNGVTVIPAAQFMGGVGGGEGRSPQGLESSSGGTDIATGAGAGFGVAGRPTGAFVITGDEVKWVPAVDVNRLLFGFQVVLVFFFLVVRSIAKSRAQSGTPAS